MFVMFLQGCVAVCCTSFHMADIPALMALWWTPGVTLPADLAIASKGNTHRPVSPMVFGAEHTQFVQVYIVVLFCRSKSLVHDLLNSQFTSITGP